MKSLSVCMRVHDVIPDSPIYFEYLLHFGGKKHVLLIRFTRRVIVSQARAQNRTVPHQLCESTSKWKSYDEFVIISFNVCHGV